jgi:hypothetical protein
VGVPIRRTVLTVPASYRADRHKLMIAAGLTAGFTDVDLLAEPVATAFAPVAGAPFRRATRPEHKLLTRADAPLTLILRRMDWNPREVASHGSCGRYRPRDH